jgi:hypothetical protein
MCRKEFSTPYNLRVHVRQATLVSNVAYRIFPGFVVPEAAFTPFLFPESHDPVMFPPKTHQNPFLVIV